jgi:hypothetical protein
MQAPEMLLQAPQGVREHSVLAGVHHAGKVGNLPHTSDANSQPVQSVHRRASARPAVGADYILPFPSPAFLENPKEAGSLGRAGPRPYRFAEVVEEASLPFRPEEGSHELAAGTRIIPQAGPVPVEPVGL